MEHFIKEIIERISDLLGSHHNNQHKDIMTALENLTQSVQELTASVDAAVTLINTPHPTDAQVQAAADAINAQVARLNGAVNPAPAEPV